MENLTDILKKEETLDPQDWEGLRQLGHQMVDDMLEFLKTVQKYKKQPTLRTYKP